MIRFLPLPKDLHANVLFTEFTDNDALLEALRMTLMQSRIMIQVHENRHTAAFLGFFENGNVAIWPKRAFTQEDSVQMGKFFKDMLASLQMPLFRTIVGENEHVTLLTLLSSGWHRDGIWRQVGRQQTGEWIDGLILTFDGKPLPQEDLHEFHNGHVLDTEAETGHDADDDAPSPSPAVDSGPLPADADADVEWQLAGDLWPVQIWRAAVSQR